MRPFTRQEVDALLNQRLAPNAPIEPLSRVLYELTGGNPLYVSEILDSISQADVNAFESIDDWIPDTLREALRHRLETLAPAAQEVAQAISVFESAAPREAIRLMSRQAERNLGQLVSALQALGWIEADTAGVLRWRNRLFREVIYSAMEPSLRMRLHEAAVDALQQLNAYETMIIQQACHCKPSPERLAQLHDAYRRLRGQIATRVRLQILDTLLEWATKLGDAPRRVQLLCERPYLLFQLPDGLLHALDASQQALAALDALSDADPQGELRVQVTCARAGQLSQLGRMREAQESLLQLLETPTLSDSQRLMVELSLAYVYACQGELRRAYEIHRAVWVRLAENQAWLSRWSGVIQYTLRYALMNGDATLAQQTLVRLESWAAQPDPTAQIQMLYQSMYAESAYFGGRGAELQARARALMELTETLGEPLSALEPWFFTWLYRQPQEAARVATRALQLAQHAFGQEREAEWRYRLAQARLEAAQFPEAVEAAEAARRAALKIGNQWIVAKAWLLLAQIHWATRQPHHARDALQQAAPLVQKLDLPELHCEYLLMQGLLDEEPCTPYAEQAVQCADAWGHALYRGLAYALRAHAWGKPADAEQAELLLAEYGAPLITRRLTPRAALAHATSDILIELLGEGAIQFRNQRLTRKQWASPRARALCAHLILLGGTPADTHTLIEHHFPHLDPDKARVNLQTVISAARRSLRKCFGENAGDWIRFENGLYRWSPPHAWRLDVQEFEAVAKDALAIINPDEQLTRLDEVLQRYPGDLLPEFADEPWCTLPHQNARMLFLECLLARAQRLFVKARYHDAIADCERILQIDPTEENALRLMLRLYHQLGRPADARRLMTQAQRHLQDTLGVSLARATLQTYESLFLDVADRDTASDVDYCKE